MKLHPFRALRPVQPERVVSPPYDVIDTEEALALAGANAASFLHVIRPEIGLAPGVDIHDASVYAAGAAALARFVEEGILTQDETDAVWLYRLTDGEHQQTGFVGCSEVADYNSGAIKKHEYTRPDKEDDRTRHVATMEAQAGPVFLACRGNAGLADIQGRITAQTPDVSVTTSHDDVRHELWAIRDADTLATVARAFAQVEAFYIADGHHRAASAARVAEQWSSRGPGPWDRFLTVVFPANQLKILDYNRVITDLNGHDPEAFLAAIGTHFSVSTPHNLDACRPAFRHQFGMYLDGAWRRLILRDDTVDEHDAVSRLDVAVLQNLVLTPLLGIEDPRTDTRISFVGGRRGLETLAERVDANGTGVAFAMFPTSTSELFAVADADAVMPPKSTWFEPKLASGLFTHSLKA
jgi:uncharacterized protein (DUF1015 family)